MKTATALGPLAAILVATGCAGSSTFRGSIAGSWQMRVTRAQLVHNPAYAAYGYGADAKELAKVDAGTFRLVLERGRLAIYDRSRHGWTLHDTGRYDVKGDRVRFQIASGHDTGEIWVYRWSIYRDELSFHKAGGGAPPNPTFAPWHRSGQ